MTASASSQRDKTSARGPAPGRACTPASAPLQPGRRPRRAHSDQPPDAREGVHRGWGGRLHGFRRHFGTSLEDHGPNVVLQRAGPQTARLAGSLRGHDQLRLCSSSARVSHQHRTLTSSVREDQDWFAPADAGACHAHCPGTASPTSNSPPRNGATGSTTNASTARPATSRPTSTKPPTTLNTSWRLGPKHGASTDPGAVHLQTIDHAPADRGIPPRIVRADVVLRSHHQPGRHEKIYMLLVWDVSRTGARGGVTASGTPEKWVTTCWP
jgi:hypothetical protein